MHALLNYLTREAVSCMLDLHSTSSIAPVAVPPVRPAVVITKAVRDLSLRTGFTHGCMHALRTWETIYKKQPAVLWIALKLCSHASDGYTYAEQAHHVCVADSSADCAGRLLSSLLSQAWVPTSACIFPVLHLKI